ncbi:GntR family transcriptional regulator [Streptomyces sp. TRM72054]|uniref:GntR family transcriptional regulator n=1 Tax=Streptomyces sp. TRM72054 TaxID=2870562 RepID=UPI001C8C4C5D|nr:GntR family transcriptional regulator [Streptomyces sp. TRM72054]MBX9399544.1 GntR family transcriptional regulator [Streptomyces sp. TRM72054]
MGDNVKPSSPRHPALPGRPASASLSSQAYEAVRDLIVTLQIPPGAPISEGELMHQLGLGRTPVHQAIKRLEGERLVSIYPRRGTFAAEVNITDLALISEVRLQLEGHAAYCAAQRRTQAERDELHRLLAQFEHPDVSDEALMRLDTDVHRAIYRCTHNSYLEATLAQYYNLVLRIWYLFLDRLPHVSEHIVEHRPLLEAIIEGDAERARQIVSDHVVSFEREVRSVM